MKRKNKMFISILVGLIIILIVLLCTIMVFRIINKNKSLIKTENGIQESIYVEIGGIKQFIQIRGEDKDNPVILWLHGGPGYPLTYLSYYYQKELEKDFTIVCWEQRGSGRTYYENDNKEVSIELLLNDTDEIVDYLLERFNKDKIIVMGQSWGTVLGRIYVSEHFEKVYAYVGVGQVIDFDRGKIFAAEKGINVAKEQGNLEDANILQKSIDSFIKINNIEEIDIKNLEQMIILSLKYLRSNKEMSGLKQMWTGITSPDMSFNDLKWFLNATKTEKIFNIENELIQYMYFDFNIDNLDSNYNIPIYYIQGENDYITPTELVLRYYEKINAPNKNIVIIKESGHTPFLDNPEKFSDAVKKLLN